MNVPVRKGMLLKHQNRFWFVEDVTERHSGKQRPTFHISLRDALDGRHIERTLDELEPLEEVAGSYRNLQYLYPKGSSRVFMDGQTFEEIELTESQLQGCQPFLKEGEEFKVLFADDQPLRLEMPEVVTLKVAETAAPTHAVGTSANIMKEARLDNGLEIRVPLFIKTGDMIRVSTKTRQYLGKAGT